MKEFTKTLYKIVFWVRSRKFCFCFHEYGCKREYFASEIIAIPYICYTVLRSNVPLDVYTQARKLWGKLWCWAGSSLSRPGHVTEEPRSLRLHNDRNSFP